MIFGVTSNTHGQLGQEDKVLVTEYGDGGGGEGGRYVPESKLWMEVRRERASDGGPLTSDVVPKSLYHPITILAKFKSSSIICATPINTFLPSMRP